MKCSICVKAINRSLEGNQWQHKSGNVAKTGEGGLGPGADSKGLVEMVK